MKWTVILCTAALWCEMMALSAMLLPLKRPESARACRVFDWIFSISGFLLFLAAVFLT